MRQTTPISPVSQSLWSPRWPQRTCGGKSPAVLRVSPTSPRPVLSGLQTCLQIRFPGLRQPHPPHSRTPADHPGPPRLTHCGDPSRQHEISESRRDGPRRIKQGQCDGVSRQPRAPRARGLFPVAPASARRPPPVTESYRSMDRTQCHSNSRIFVALAGRILLPRRASSPSSAATATGPFGPRRPSLMSPLKSRRALYLQGDTEPVRS